MVNRLSGWFRQTGWIPHIAKDSHIVKNDVSHMILETANCTFCTDKVDYHYQNERQQLCRTAMEKSAAAGKKESVGENKSDHSDHL